ncbi:MAG TPA: dephospho-CoA kinase [Chloroflexota bacterium]
MAFVLGLTGNIACGKSSVGTLLTDRFGADYVDADRIVHALYAAGTPETRAIAARFGPDLLQPDGTIDRRRLGDVVMADRAALKELEQILDPGVRGAIEARLTSTPSPVVVLDAIRLIEGGLYQRCNAVWVVVCEPRLQIERLQASRHFTLEQATLRVNAQAPVEDKLRHATAVIHNDGALDALEASVADAWASTVKPYLAVQSSPP